MIACKNELELALQALVPCYTKILKLDLNNDTYEIIKIGLMEYYNENQPEHLSDWLYQFAISPKCYPANRDDFVDFSNIKTLKKLKKPKVMVYKRLVDGEYCNVAIEVVPLDDGFMYLFIRDLEGGTHV